tara:strand:- start:358 stop:1101 length:744 start_codon:yes stop_codon:yes gene_type:complete
MAVFWKNAGNKTNAIQAVRTFINELPMNTPFKNPCDPFGCYNDYEREGPSIYIWTRLNELLKHHPDKAMGPGQVQWFKMMRHPTWKKPALYFKNKKTGEVDDISWLSCVKNYYAPPDMPHNHRTNVIKAFRNEIHSTKKRRFYLNNTKITNEIRSASCRKCKTTTYSPQVDHFPITFSRLFDDFLDLSGLKIAEIKVQEERTKCLWTIYDYSLGCKWRKFHDKEVQYRILCSTCNQSENSYGYKHKY